MCTNFYVCWLLWCGLGHFLPFNYSATLGGVHAQQERKKERKYKNSTLSSSYMPNKDVLESLYNFSILCQEGS